MKIIQRLLIHIGITFLFVHQTFGKDWFTSVREGDMKAVEASICNHKIKIDQTTKNRTTALMIAAKHGNTKNCADSFWSRCYWSVNSLDVCSTI